MRCLRGADVQTSVRRLDTSHSANLSSPRQAARMVASTALKLTGAGAFLTAAGVAGVGAYAQYDEGERTHEAAWGPGSRV